MTMIINFPTLMERISGMSPLDLADLAKSEALAMADSSRLEGLMLDEERIRTELLAGYIAILESRGIRI